MTDGVGKAAKRDSSASRKNAAGTAPPEKYAHILYAK